MIADFFTVTLLVVAVLFVLVLSALLLSVLVVVPAQLSSSFTAPVSVLPVVPQPRWFLLPVQRKKKSLSADGVIFTLESVMVDSVFVV